MKKYFPSSELIINEDGSVFHLHVKPEWLADKVILVGDPGRVALVASHFENKECEVESREFKTITGIYKGKRITVVSTGIGCDNIDIVMNELDALANIAFETREEKEKFRQLELVRIGTFPASTTQICVVHQIRNSCRYVVWKEKKEFTADLKNIYNAPTKEAAEMELDNFEQKWGAKYPYAIRSWRNNWEELTVFFDFPVEIRKIIYTTNLIENLNGKIRKYTKNKLSFPNDDALKKSVYLAINEIEKKWYQPIWNWALIFNQFITIFENRIQV